MQRRLQPEAFGLPAAPQATMGVIQNQARPVLAAAREILVHEEIAFVTQDGSASIPLLLPPELRSLTQSQFTLSVQTYPKMGAVPENFLRELAQSNFWRNVETGWQIVSHADGRATLQVDHASLGKNSGLLNARLTANRPLPATLESQPFAIPAGARLRLSFGPSRAQAAPLRFRANLACSGEAAATILDREVATLDAAQRRWHEVVIDHAGPSADCLLTLQTSPPTPLVGGGLWAWPEILQPLPRDDDARPPNVILVSLDTLRADHLSGYGYPRATSPQIDARLIDQGTSFLNVTTTFPQTDISHLSLFTGLYPEAQPVRGRLRGGTAITTLAQALRQGGFATAAITENALVSGAFGFWFGFDQFTERSVVEEKLGATSFADARAFLREKRDERFFLFLHTYQTHDPYDSSPPYEALFRDDGHWQGGGPPPFVPEKTQHLADAYDRTIRETDNLMAGLLDTLDELGLSSDTLLVVLSDHGESFGEHGIPGHGFAAHEEQLRVPLILRGPGIPVGRRVAGPASLTDVAPTLLELLGLAPLAQGQGQSLVPWLHEGSIDPERIVYFSWIGPEARGARAAGWKALQTSRETRNYDLESDPFEWHTRRKPSLPAARQATLDAHSEESRALRERLEGNASAHAADVISERTENSLRALGYID
ncbi:MAG: sulfatase [Deltaproteobacteria bacterium]